MKKCIKSQNLVYRSSTFEETRLYYSYSTCGSSAEDWLDFDTTKIFLKNETLRVAIPALTWPLHYKVNPTSGERAKDFEGPEYFMDEIPWNGWIIDYFDEMLKVSNMPPVEYVHTSVGSQNKGIGSTWTQAVSDVEAGVADFYFYLLGNH